MKLNYYPDTDSLYIDLSEQTSVESREISEGVVLDYDADGNLVGIDIDNAAPKLNSTSSRSVSYQRLLKPLLADPAIDTDAKRLHALEEREPQHAALRPDLRPQGVDPFAQIGGNADAHRQVGEPRRLLAHGRFSSRLGQGRELALHAAPAASRTLMVWRCQTFRPLR
jgi:uncharacterized protein YuzE